MSIFDNNVTPEVPKDKTWNNIGYELWMDVLNEDHYRRYGPENMWFSTYEEAIEYSYNYKYPWSSKNQIKKAYRKHNHLSKRDIELLDEAIQRIYNKYGVWLKYRIQYGKTGGIKSIYFVRFC